MEALKGPWEEGEHTVAVTATDGAGNRRETEPIAFVYDTEPPRLTWGVEGSAVPVGSLEGTAPLSGTVPPIYGHRLLRGYKRDWLLSSDLAQIVARPQTRKLIRFEGLATKIGPEKGLWLKAEDAVCPELDHLTYDLVPGNRKEPSLLRIEAMDCVGNALRWQRELRRSKR